MSIQAISYAYIKADEVITGCPTAITDPDELMDAGAESATGRRIDLEEPVSHPWDEGKLISTLPVLSGHLLNDTLAGCYALIIRANNTLRDLKGSGVPDVLLRNARQRLQEAVNSLFGPADGSFGLGALLSRELVRRVGQRQSNSFRSVLVPGPEMHIDQCGVPVEMLAQGIGKFGKVLLNRAPTLHRQNLQTLEAVPEDSKAIRIHPMACYALNADFDGDQAAVYGFGSEETAVEAEEKMSLVENLFLSRSGDLIIFPTQEMVYGLAYMTSLDGNSADMSFDTAVEALKAYEAGSLGLRQPVRLLSYGDSGALTSIGRLLFALEIPRSVKVPDAEMTKPALKELLASIVKEAGAGEAIGTAERLMRLGFRHATASGVSIGLGSIPPELDGMKAAFLNDVECDGNDYGCISKLTNATIECLSKSTGPARELLRIVDSGARGNRGQLGQLLGARGFMATSGGMAEGIPADEATIPGLPVFESFAEGTPAWAHFASAFGWRRGLVDRWYCDEAEAGITHGLLLALTDIRVKAGGCIGHDSVLKCTSTGGVCPKCYGNDPATARQIAEGAAVGLGAAFALTEPLLQMPLESHGELKNILASAAEAEGIGVLTGLVDRLLALYGNHGVNLLRKHAEVAIGGLAGKWSTGRVFESLTLDIRQPMKALAEAARENRIDAVLGVREYLLTGCVPSEL